eukprot:TRINITY_DN5059_c0_g1_i4.p1 TRINITY_DN5059_c0_g1~~TRINITY_DN5059_c0_g1_i4.p1  ORF type:complete len:795 (+),score=226.03 TRINITY_DN5059_c0_g1_i4:328-2385(+)
MPLAWRTRIRIASEIAQAMEYLHDSNFIHRDLKSKNILLDTELHARVADFGLARSHDVHSRQQRVMTLCGTDEWMAPEVILGMEYDQAADVFSYGIVLCEIITRKKPNDQTLNRTPQMAFGLDFDELRTLAPSDCPPQLLQLAMQCAEYEPELRPEFKQIVQTLAELDRVLAEAEAKKAAEAEKKKDPAPAPATAPAPAPTPAPAPVAVVVASSEPASAPAPSPAPAPAPAPSPSPSPSPATAPATSPGSGGEAPKDQLTVPGRSMTRSNSTGRKPSNVRLSAFELQAMFIAENSSAHTAKLARLVERATHETHTDIEFVHDLLLTYGAFTTPTELLSELMARFEGTAAQSGAEAAKALKVVRLRVMNVIRLWLDKYCLDFLADTVLLDNLARFVNTRVTKEGLQNAAKAMTRLLELRQAEYQKQATVHPAPRPAKKLMATARPTLVTQFPAAEVARQLTMATFELFVGVHARELLRTAAGALSTDKADSKQPQQLGAFLGRSTLVSAWVASDIVAARDAKERVKVLTHFVAVADTCLTLNNFTALFDICAALTSPPIKRLTETFAMMDKTHTSTLKSILALINPDGDYRIIRKVWSSPMKPPRMPPVEVFLSDLRSLHTDMPALVDGQINFEKFRKMAVAIQNVTQAQLIPYTFPVDEALRTYLDNLLPLSDAQIMSMSLAIQP